ncbi:MAG: hypothetical protein AVDCRST_MAG93-3859, partial [uncultured Chloroflexia bacterium]
MTKPETQAVIFDLDGLLIDSEIVWNTVRAEIAAQRGVVWTEADHRAVMGVSTAEWVAYMIERLELDLGPAEVQELVSSRMVASYRERIPLKPGAMELVHKVGEHLPVGLASGSVRNLIDIVISAPEFAGRFRAVVSADEVGRGKPHPDVYLETARRLVVAPEACVCLEDSGHGIDAGKAAGMRVIAVPDPRFMPEAATLARADVVVDSLTEVTLEM